MAKPLILSLKLHHPVLLPSVPLFPSSTPSLSFSLLSPSKPKLKPSSIPSSPNPNPPSGTTECPVPLDQQPINEYQSLSSSSPFSWALSSNDAVVYSSRLVATGLAFAVLVGLPVSLFGPGRVNTDPVRLVLGSVSGGLFAVTLAVVRMYLGWAYVGNRLLSATVEYEETGWYDGQIWVKTPEVLARDRLLGSFQVKPILSRLKNTLVALAISLSLCVSTLVNYEGSQRELPGSSNQTGERVVAGVYKEDSARSFEPDAFCGDSGLVAE